MRKDPLAKLVFLLVGAALAYLTFHIMVFLFSPHEKVRRDPPSTFESMAVVVTTTSSTAAPTTTTTEAPTTTTTIEHTTTSRANRGVPRTTEVVTDAPFWRRLADCESSTGRGGNGGGYFQFSPDTAAKVGIDGSESYEDQRAAAITWAALIHPNEGTRSGWPHCWWVALAG